MSALMRLRRRSLIALIATALVMSPVLVRAQSTSVGLEIQPSQTELDLKTRSYETTIKLVNHDSFTYDVQMSLAALGHDLDGAPQYLPSSTVSNAFKLSATSFQLASGKAKDVSLKGTIPQGSAAIYFGVLAEYKRAGEQAGQSVETRTRLGSEFLLRGPRPWIERLKVLDVGATPGPGNDVTLYAIVNNNGNVHERPTGTLSVSKNGHVYVKLSFALNAAHRPGAIIPGFSRRFTAVWHPPAGFTGAFTVTATVNGPIARGTKTVSFANGRALAPDAKIEDLSAVNQNGLIVDTEVANRGTGRLDNARLTLVATQDGRFERARETFSIATLAAGASTAKRWDAGTMPDGSYQVTASLQQGSTVLDQRIAGVRIGAAASGTSAALIGGLSGLGVVLLALAIWFVYRRGVRRGEHARTQGT
jgi:hypothetical protein